MEAAENRASRDLAVLGEGMSVVALPRHEYRRGFRNPRSEAQMGASFVVRSHPLSYGQNSRRARCPTHEPHFKRASLLQHVCRNCPKHLILGKRS
jgi:hypothetical protein